VTTCAFFMGRFALHFTQYATYSLIWTPSFLLQLFYRIGEKDASIIIELTMLVMMNDRVVDYM
jgi:hypothetical protein